MTEQKILLGSTQTLLSYPLVNDGTPVRIVPSSVTVRIGTPAVQMPDEGAGVSATVDPLSTTTSAAAVEGATTLSVASATWVRGRRYLIGGANPQEITCAQIDGASTSLRVAEPIPVAIASGATISGFAVYKALTAAQTEFVGEGLALWRAVMNSITYEWRQSFQIVRALPQYTLTATKLTQGSYGALVRTLHPRQDTDFSETIAAGWSNRIEPLLSARKVKAEDVISWDALEPLHRMACVMELVEGAPTFSNEVFERIARRYHEMIEETFAAATWYAAPQVALPAARDGNYQPVVQGVRLTR